MKIVQVINSLIGGGAERVTIVLARAFAKLGHESIIVVFEPGGAFFEEDENISVQTIEKKNAVASIRAMNADLVLLHMKTPHKLFANVFDENIFFIVHNTQSMRLKKHFYSKYFLYESRRKRLCKLYDHHRIVTVSKGVEKDLLHEIGVKPESITTIYNPFDIDQIVHAADEKISFDKPFIINVAGLRKAKRQDILLKAYAKLDTDRHLVILGEGKLRTSLEKLAKSLGISEKVHFLGWQDNPYAWIKRADLFVLSSEFEGLPTVLIESLILHTPVVSTNCPSGPSEILTGELAQYLAKINDIEDLYLKIERALSHEIKISSKYYAHFKDTQIAQCYLSLIE